MFQSQQVLQQRYRLEKQLGRTATGHQTWLATDLYNQDAVTIKLLAFNPQMRWEELKLFEREAKILQHLDHPQIPSYRDYFDIDSEHGGGIPWFVLVQEYIPGLSLQEMLEQHQCFSPTQVRSLTIQVLEILQYLHQLVPPVLHRDIKPSNLILGEDGQIYLIDFGAVQAQAGVTGVTFTVVGTSGYAPLEQFWGRAVPASDIYALGATTIHLLTGISPVNLPQKNSRIQFADRVNLDQDWQNWLETATAPALEQRFLNATEALQALTTPVVKDSGYLPMTTTGNKRPVYTRIKLTQTPEKLEIFFPSGGYRRLGKVIDPDFWQLERKILARISQEFNEVSALNMVIILMSVVIILIVIGLPLVFFGVLLAKLLILYGENIEVYIDHERLEIVRQSLGFIYGGKRISLEDILEIKLKKRDYIHEIVLETKTDTFLIGQALREDECRWIIEAIQNWLSRVRPVED